MLDTATPLTMVLSETTGAETTHYWHALDTLAQSDGTTTEYFALDGLGSVRQLVDASGSVTLAQTFDPYGSGYAASGSASSSLGWTGEQVDGNGFVYLRARYYAPGMGRFFQRDTWEGDNQRPQSLNVYMYVEGRVVVMVDPTGQSPLSDPAQANGDVTSIPTYYDLTGTWFQQRQLEFEPEGDLVLPAYNQYGIIDNACDNNACGISALSFVTLNLPDNKEQNPNAGQDPRTLYDYLDICLDTEGLLFEKLEGLAKDFEYATNFVTTPLPPVSPELNTYEKRLRAQYDEFYANIQERFPDEFAISLVGHEGDTLSQHVVWCDIPDTKYKDCPADNRKSNGHFVVVAGLSKQYHWNRGDDWQWVKIYNPLGEIEYHRAQSFFDWQGGIDNKLLFIGK